MLVFDQLTIIRHDETFIKYHENEYFNFKIYLEVLFVHGLKPQ